ncbi:hypothetical protein [Nodularia sp. UHCC 0506]|uniref:hypothetical protein n=1 Tax=Nodularia sp. UHCC 0506 TaxID=3110243 RepID=UPI002B1ECD07|nr:hypothetical protein [Nodularia sp. UHCC 0506]MEA5514556.1 hypothetical protein [Nodularia sp. UHCC 0506]
MQEHLLNTFAQLSDVLQIELQPEFSVIDYEGQSFIIISIESDDRFTIRLNEVDTVISGFDSTKLFNIKNAMRIGFIPIDGKKGLLGFGFSYCDFIFFDENDFCFVEFKLNAISSAERAIRKRRKEAISQLKNTINLFDDKLAKSYAGLNLEAYVCTPEFYPRLDASWRELAQDFLEEYGVPLFETNDKICK